MEQAGDQTEAGDSEVTVGGHAESSKLWDNRVINDGEVQRQESDAAAEQGDIIVTPPNPLILPLLIGKEVMLKEK